jgi:hypothetical protein
LKTEHRHREPVTLLHRNASTIWTERTPAPASAGPIRQGRAFWATEEQESGRGGQR